MESTSSHLPRLATWLRAPRILALAAVLFCVAGAVAWEWDDAVSATARGYDIPGDLEKAIHLSEVFGHGMGAAAILVTVYWIAVQRRSAVLAAALLAGTSGLTANLMKGIVARVRPHSVESLESAAELKQLGASQAGARMNDVVGPTLDFWDSRQRSFPSGHAATAWGLALGLAVAFPRGVWFFAFFASLASFQRLVSGSHYLSDVLAGTAIAFAWATIWMVAATRSQRLARLFDAAHFP